MLLNSSTRVEKIQLRRRDHPALIESQAHSQTELGFASSESVSSWYIFCAATECLVFAETEEPLAETEREREHCQGDG